MLKKKLLENSLWSILSSLFQNAIFSIFFIIMARSYETGQFSEYIIANTLYGLILSFSSLGMSQWYIREYEEGEKGSIVSTLFLKIQLLAGVTFYVINILLSHLIYKESAIHTLSLFLGINIVFDNLIYVFKTVNIISFQQRQTFKILSIEATLKLALGFFILYSAPNVMLVISILLLLRLLTLSLFFSGEKKGLFDFKKFFQLHLDVSIILKTLYSNRYFLVIGSISVLFWSVGNILVSKFLDIKRVADYEISFKLFTMAEIIPVMISATIFPILVDKVKSNQLTSGNFIKTAFIGNLLYGLFAYTFVISFSTELIPLLFGEKYSQTANYCNEMFLTILIFPTVLFQANLLVALKMEKIDMYLNLLSLFVNLTIAILGLYFTNSLSAVNYSIFISFLIFHLSQEYFLIKKGITQVNHLFTFYILLTIVLFGYSILKMFLPVLYLFPIFWTAIFLLLLPQLKLTRAKA
jgi:O-antigen/teichoic acid export membrane protein